MFGTYTWTRLNGVGPEQVYENPIKYTTIKLLYPLKGYISWMKT